MSSNINKPPSPSAGVGGEGVHKNDPRPDEEVRLKVPAGSQSGPNFSVFYDQVF